MNKRISSKYRIGNKVSFIDNNNVIIHGYITGCTWCRNMWLYNISSYNCILHINIPEKYITVCK